VVAPDLVGQRMIGSALGTRYLSRVVAVDSWDWNPCSEGYGDVTRGASDVATRMRERRAKIRLFEPPKGGIIDRSANIL